MGALDTIRLRCEQCGHEWNPRNTEGTARQCSKCRSRQIIELPREPEQPIIATPVPFVIADTVPVKTEGRPRSRKVDEEYLNDPEVQAKLKELQLARLERQIAEEKSSIEDFEAFDRLVGNYKYLLTKLGEQHLLSKEDYRILASECSRCGGSAMHLDVEEARWVCQKCGKIIAQ